MGVVFRAKDQKLQRFVAMKFLPGDVEVGSTLHRLFLREARAAAALSHPGIVTVYDVGELDGREFIAMELVDGKTLDRVLDEDGPLPLPEALEVMEKVLLAMEYAHTKSVIHRDLKPANLMRTRDGVKVMDFGLAKVVSGRSSSGQTLIAGTPSYMPPEQKTGHADHRSDIFALGATFYELMSGVLPGNPGEPPSATSDYPTLRQRVPGSPARLSDLVMRCLDHDRNHRPQDIVSVLRELREIRAEVARAPVEPQPRRRAEHPAAASPKLVDDVKKLRAPAPRISREEDDDAPHVERVERVEKVAASPVKPRPAGARPIIPREEDDGVAPGARRGKPR
ncbi:MAG: protein kinase [Polyangiaceae bacterium]|nr:protein kinase [Polyangiaceae bacterium]